MGIWCYVAVGCVFSTNSGISGVGRSALTGLMVLPIWPPYGWSGWLVVGAVGCAGLIFVSRSVVRRLLNGKTNDRMHHD